MSVTEAYIQGLVKGVVDKIDSHLSAMSVAEIIDIAFTKRKENAGFQRFQQFYFSEVGTNSSNYFNTFRSRYSLQGVDEAYISKLNSNKEEIFLRLQNNDLLGVYRDFFYKQRIVHGATHREKSLGSFFTKLCHTAVPEAYTPMDNPMRNHFGLQDESFPIAMLVVSNAFRCWTDSNRSHVNEIKNALAEAISSEASMGISVSPSQITDMKLMDMIYWSAANPD